MVKILKSRRALQLCFWQPQEESDKREGAAEHQRAPLVLPPPPPPPGGPPRPSALPRPPRSGGPAPFEQSQGFLPSRLGCPGGRQAGSPPTHPGKVWQRVTRGWGCRGGGEEGLGPPADGSRDGEGLRDTREEEL